MDYRPKVFLLVLSCSIVPAALCLDLETNESSLAVPTFLTESLVLNVVEGKNVTFPCVVSAKKPVLLWYKGTQLLFANGVPFTQNSRYRLQNELPHHNLTISNIELTDEDDYICHVNNLNEKQVNKLFVNIPPTILEHSREFIEAKLMQNVTLNCSAEGKPEPVITWTKKSGLLPNGDPSFRGRSLILTNLDGRHNGAYTCTASNGAGVPAVAHITLNIEFGARLMEPIPPVEHSGLGEDLQLLCAFEGNPSGEAVWLKDGEPATGPDTPNREVETARQPGVDMSLLRITGVTDEDLGDYLCVVNNSLGSANATYHVTGLPRQPTVDHSTHAGYATQYKLRWTVKSHQVTELFQILYRTAAVGNITEAGSWRTAKVTGEESISQEVDSSQHMYSHHYVLQGLTPSTAYQIKVRAKNSFGWGKESTVLVMETSDEDPTSPPTTQPVQVTKELKYKVNANPKGGNSHPSRTGNEVNNASDVNLCHTTTIISILVAAFIGQRL